jgi:hypothetical protein
MPFFKKWYYKFTKGKGGMQENRAALPENPLFYRESPVCFRE